MRVIILLSVFIIADIINPDWECNYDDITMKFITIVFMTGMLMDITEWLKKITSNNPKN